MKDRPYLQDGLGGNNYLALGTAIKVLIFSHQQASGWVNLEVGQLGLIGMELKPHHLMLRGGGVPRQPFQDNA